MNQQERLWRNTQDNKVYADSELYYEHDLWSRIRDFAVSLEVHGKEWHGGNKLNSVFTNLFTAKYTIIKKSIASITNITDAQTSQEYVRKLEAIQLLIIFLVMKDVASIC